MTHQRHWALIGGATEQFGADCKYWRCVEEPGRLCQ